MSENEIIDALRDSLLGYEVLTSDEIEIKLGKISDKIINQSSDLARLRELLGEVVKQTKEIKGEESENQSVERMVEWHKLRSRIQSELKE